MNIIASTKHYFIFAVEKYLFRETISLKPLH